jgi:mannitol-specific phosphotransferase system IIBC component
MGDGSEMLTYLLSAVVVVILAVIGWYVGAKWNYKEVGAVAGAVVGIGAVYWYNSSGGSAVASYSF